MKPTSRTATVSLLLLPLISAVLLAQASPANLQATAAGSTTVNLTWNAAAGATGYVVQRAIGSAALDRLTPNKISGTAYSDAAAPAATALRYRIKAVYAGNGHTYSAVVSVTTPSAPASTASSPPAATATPAGSPAPTAVVALPAPITEVGLAPVQLPGSPVTAAPASSAPVAERNRIALPTGTTLEARPGSRALIVGPTGVAVSGTPLVARVSWDAMANAQRYAVRREDGITAPLERTPANFTGRELQDTVPDPRVTYRYVVTAYYADGSSGEAAAVAFSSPPLLNPSGFTAHDLGEGRVSFQWQAVPGAKEYRLDGTGLPNTGLTAPTNSFTLINVPVGPGAWSLVALYPGNFADYSGPSVVSQVVHVLPSHGTKWLSKANGAGDPARSFLHYLKACARTDISTRFGQRSCPASLHALLSKDGSGVEGIGKVSALFVPGEALYGNAVDLGSGRRTWCGADFKAGVGPVTVCYAISFGPGPGEAGFGDPSVFMSDAWNLSHARTITVIVKDPTGMQFMAYNANAVSHGYDSIEDSQSIESLALDTEGSKFTPQTCLACHGGTVDANGKVQGASFLPLNPATLEFVGGAVGREPQEEPIRQINRAILMAPSNPAVTAYINGLYNGQVMKPGTHAVDEYIPSGWSEQAGLYRSIVGPYCANCHLAARPEINFASYGNFSNNAALIQNAVCVAHTMPHAEIPFRAFWTKDTGALYLPGLLSATLGYSSCP
jgi:hypothetical protein